MATDSTELTFVRCPSCRSLVPAVYPRCRMCGATLDANATAGAAGEQGGASQGSSRVRQKTMTTSSSDEMAEQVQRLRDENSEVNVAETQSSAAPSNTEIGASPAGGTDPLAQYLSEDKSEDEELLDDQDFDDDDFLEEDDFDDEEELEELDDKPAEEEQKAAPSESSTQIAEEHSLQKTLKEASKVVEELKASEPKKEEVKPRVVVDQGRSRFGKSGLSFGSKKDDRKFEVKRAETESAEPAVQVETKVESVEPKETEYTTKPMETPMAAIKPKPAWNENAVREVAKKGDKLGRIYGWLVSFVDPNGSSIELREGRFFVTSNGLRENDLVLNDSTISTPHALFTVGVDSGIVIQDLKSDRGVFVREKDGTSYKREFDSATLCHGDWVRFGDLEFLVSVVANVGAK